MRQKQKGFTLVETLTVVIIIGLLSGLAVVKLAEASDLTQTNYLKSTSAMLDRGVEVYTVKNGSFPDIPDGTPEERVLFIVNQLESGNIIVQEDMPKLLALKKYLAEQINISTSAIKANIEKARKGVASGDPYAKEILVLPKGVIVYPEKAEFLLNDPENPDSNYHQYSYWVPKQVKTASESFKNTGSFGNEDDKNLVLNNLKYSDLSADQIKSLITTQNSSDNATISSQLLSVLSGDDDVTLNLNQSDLVELIEQGLNGSYASEAIKNLNLDNVDWNNFSLDTIASIVHDKTSLMSESQIDDLIQHLSQMTIRDESGNLLSDISLLASDLSTKAKLTTAQYTDLVNNGILDPKDWSTASKLLYGYGNTKLGAEAYEAFINKCFESGGMLGNGNLKEAIRQATNLGYTIAITPEAKTKLVSNVNSMITNRDLYGLSTSGLGQLLEFSPESATPALIESMLNLGNGGSGGYAQNQIIAELNRAGKPMPENLKNQIIAANGVLNSFAFYTKDFLGNTALNSTDLGNIISSNKVSSYEGYGAIFNNPSLSPTQRSNLLSSNSFNVKGGVLMSGNLTPGEIDNVISTKDIASTDINFLSLNKNLNSAQLSTLTGRVNESTTQETINSLFNLRTNLINNPQTQISDILTIVDTAISASPESSVGMHTLPFSLSSLQNTTAGKEVLSDIREHTLAKVMSSDNVNPTLTAIMGQLASPVQEFKKTYDTLSADDKETFQLKMLASDQVTNGVNTSYAGIFLNDPTTSEIVRSEVSNLIAADNSSWNTQEGRNNSFILNLISKSDLSKIDPSIKGNLASSFTTLSENLVFEDNAYIASYLTAAGQLGNTFTTQEIQTVWDTITSPSNSSVISNNPWDLNQISGLLKSVNTPQSVLNDAISRIQSDITMNFSLASVYDNPNISPITIENAAARVDSDLWSTGVLDTVYNSTKLWEEISNNPNKYPNVYSYINGDPAYKIENNMSQDAYSLGSTIEWVGTSGFANVTPEWISENSTQLLNALVAYGSYYSMNSLARDTKFYNALSLDQKRTFDAALQQLKVSGGY